MTLYQAIVWRKNADGSGEVPHVVGQCNSYAAAQAMARCAYLENTEYLSYGVQLT